MAKVTMGSSMEGAPPKLRSPYEATLLGCWMLLGLPFGGVLSLQIVFDVCSCEAQPTMMHRVLVALWRPDNPTLFLVHGVNSFRLWCLR